ncbi:hypothetical protein GQ55_5G155000 [Panicum hallii var. hallii]|uniref:Uncharacterized protein n=1 Tax=Panicum hallii var. hallii TaxID=1504633 RepID=A0A2T7DGM3_9POAL|nr:hypothetical protein GQ55_5G155000 [Panicum hallii var. hallii]
MDESRKRDVPTASAENISSPLDEDFGNDFLSSWKLPKSGKDTIDFTVDSIPKSSKKFSFGNLDDFGLDGAFDKLPSFKMGMSDLDFSSPLKKKVKHSSSNGDDLSDGKKESEKNNFSFSFDFNELGKFCLDAKLGIEEKSMSKFTGKVDPVSSEVNKDAQRGLSAKASGILEDNSSKDKPQTQGVCTLRPSHPTNHESVKNASLPASNVNAADSSDKIQEHTSVSPAIMKQTKVDSVPSGNHREHPKEIYPTKAAVNIPSQNFSGSALSGEDPTQVLADPMNTKGATIADIGKIHISRESNDKEQSIGSQSKDTSTINPDVSGRLVGQFDSRNEVVEESVSLNEGSQGNRSFSDVHKKLLKKTSCGTKDTDEGTSGHKSLSSSMQRGITNVESALANERGSFSILSKSTNMKASRVELTSETALNQLSGASKVIKKMTLHPTDLKREHKQANAGPDKCKNALSKTYSKQASHGLLTTSINGKGDRNAKSGLEPPSSGNLSLLNARNSTAHTTGHKTVANHVLLKSSNASDSLHDTHSKDNKMPTISQLTGVRIAKLGIRSPMSDRVPEKESVQLTGTKGSPLTTSQTLNSVPEGKPALRSPAIMQKESVLDPKAPTVLKRIMRSPAVRKSPQTVPELGNEMILGSGTPKAHVDIAISSRMPSEMGDISDLELPMLLENDGNLEKAEACRKELEDICILLKRKHAEAKELAVRAIVNNNTMLMLNHPMFEEKICSIKKFANDLRSKKYLFEEVGSINAATATSKAIISLIGSAVYSWRPKAGYLSVHQRAFSASG